MDNRPIYQVWSASEGTIYWGVDKEVAYAAYNGLSPDADNVLFCNGEVLEGVIETRED